MTILAIAVIVIILLTAIFAMMTRVEPTQATASHPAQKILVLYFSPAGTTAKVAKEIARQLNADTFEIKGAKPYKGHPTHRAFWEWITGATPELAEPLPDLSAYDTIFLGYPVWYGTAPMVIKQALKSTSFADKNVVPFVHLTAISKNNGRSIRLIRQHAPRAIVLPRLMLAKPDAKAINDYLKKTKLI